MPDEGQSEVQEDISYMIEAPRDLHEMYMRLRAQLSSSKSFYRYYMKMLSLLDVGSQLLPPEYRDLSDEVNGFLSSDSTYPGKRQMERQSGNLYRMGSDSTGLIIVDEKYIETGLRETLEQQTAKLLPRLKGYDSMIFKILVNTGVVDKKRPILEDLLIDQTMEELSKKIYEKQSKEEEMRKQRGVKDESS